MNDLSPAQRKQLQRLIAKLGNDQVAETNVLVPMNTTLERIFHWAQSHYVLLESPRHGAHVRVSADWLEHINRALLSQGYAPLEVTPGGNRIEQAKVSVTETKHLTESPTSYRVLLAIRSSKPPLEFLSESEPALQITDADWRQLDLSYYETLIVVENLTVFYQLETLNIEWPARELIVYRGDERHPAASQLIHSWAAMHKPCYALVDLDPVSLRMLQRGSFTHVAAPSLYRFRSLANAAHSPAEHHRFAMNLVPRGEFAGHIQYMQQKQVGLKQEWMHCEPLYWFALD